MFQRQRLDGQPLVLRLKAQMAQPLMIVLAVAACVRLYSIVESLYGAGTWCRDIDSDYVAARALEEGGDPYRPLSMLYQKYLGSVPACAIAAHPTPHTPQVLALMTVIPHRSLRELSMWWLAIQVSGIALISGMLSRLHLKSRRVVTPLLMSFALIASFPGFSDLMYGNFSSILLLLFTTVFLVESNSIRAPRGLSKCSVIGILLGLSLALKTTGWVFLLYFLLKRRWRIIAWALLLLGVSTCIVGFRYGGSELFSRFFEAGTFAKQFYAHVHYNQSVWSLGTRTFAGLEPVIVGKGLRAPGLVPFPALAPLANLIIGGGFVVFSMLFATRYASREIAFAALSLLASIGDPVAWEHNLLFSFLALVILGELVGRKKGVADTWLYFILCFAWFVACPQLWSVSDGEVRSGIIAPFTGILNLPIVALGTLLLWRMRLSAAPEPAFVQTA